MILGFIDFLFGGKNKTKLPKSAQVSSLSLNSNWNNTQNYLPNGTENLKSFNSRDLSKKPISESIYEINSEVRESTIGINEVENKVDNLEEYRKQTDEKLQKFDEQMSKLLSLYEILNNQYLLSTSKIEIDEKANTIPKEFPSEEKPQIPKELSKIINIEEEKSIESNLLELETIKIEELAGNSIPLQHIKNNTNSLVIILSWLEFLIKRVGVNETRNTLKYYSEVLKWITPQSYTELDKYLKGMKDKKKDSKPINMRDHIVSLYFISKLNERKIDKKLTNTILHIIKQ